jgi:hypothetical protein
MGYLVDGSDLPLSNIINEPRKGFVAEHGSRNRPVKKRKARK